MSIMSMIILNNSLINMKKIDTFIHLNCYIKTNNILLDLIIKQHLYIIIILLVSETFEQKKTLSHDVEES